MDLPRNDASLFQRQLFVRSAFSIPTPPEVMEQMVARMTDVAFDPGELVYKAGTPPEFVYFVVHGKVALEREGAMPFVFDEGAIIGIIDAMLSRARSRDAIAKTKVNALRVSFDDLMDIQEEFFDFTKGALVSNMRQLYELGMTAGAEHLFPAVDLQGFIQETDLQEGRDLTRVERALLMHNSRYFQYAPVQALVSLARLGRLERWSAGQKIFEVGDRCREIRIVARGRVKVERTAPNHSAIFSTGGVVLGVAAVAFDDYLYKATAESEVTTLLVTKEDLFDVMEDHFGMVRAVFKFLALENERIRTQIAEGSRDLPRPPERAMDSVEVGA